MAKKVACHITVAGRLDDYRFHICKDIASGLAGRFSQVTYDVEGMTEVDWNAYIDLKRKEFKKGGSKHRTSPVIFYNTVNYIGDEEQFRTWCVRAYGHKANKSNNVLYRGLAKKEYSSWLTENKNSFCYFDLERGGQQLGRVVFELYRTVCPRTCQNFMDLCTGSRGKGYTYKGTIIHRVIPDVFVQGGDIDGGSGDGGAAAAGGTFPDENFAIRHDRPGILAMANDGTAHTNGSQFYVTLRPMPWLDTKRVGFGRVISGMRAIKLASRVQTLNQRPLKDQSLRIVDCGEYSGPGNSKAGATGIEAVTGDATQLAQVKEVFTLASSGSKRMRPEELMLALKTTNGPLVTKFGRLASLIIKAVEAHVVKTRTKSVTVDVFVVKVMAAINNAPKLPAAAPAKASVAFGQLDSEAMSSIEEVFTALQPNENGMVSVNALEKIATSSSPALTPLAHFQEQNTANVTEVQEYFNALLSRDADDYDVTLQAFRKQLGLQ